MTIIRILGSLPLTTMIFETSKPHASAALVKGPGVFAWVEIVRGNYAFNLGQGNRRPTQGCYSMTD